MSSPNQVTGNADRFKSVADRYDQFRPRPPLIIVDLLTQLARTARPGLVVDLGSGTGLSTTIWADRASLAIGIEPNEKMRNQAHARLGDPSRMSNVEFRSGYGHETGLADGSADIVTCSQSLHWMEPETTFAEVSRILRPGGVFAAYDCDWPPTMNWQAEEAFDHFLEHCEEIGESNGWYREHTKWDKSKHLERMRSSNRFAYVREVLLHHIEQGNAERLIGVALSQARVAIVINHGVSDAKLGLERFRAVCNETIGVNPIPWYWSYRVEIGIKAQFQSNRPVLTPGQI